MQRAIIIAIICIVILLILIITLYLMFSNQSSPSYTPSPQHVTSPSPYTPYQYTQPPSSPTPPSSTPTPPPSSPTPPSSTPTPPPVSYYLQNPITSLSPLTPTSPAFYIYMTIDGYPVVLNGSYLSTSLNNNDPPYLFSYSYGTIQTDGTPYFSSPTTSFVFSITNGRGPTKSVCAEQQFFPTTQWMLEMSSGSQPSVRYIQSSGELLLYAPVARSNQINTYSIPPITPGSNISLTEGRTTSHAIVEFYDARKTLTLVSIDPTVRNGTNVCISIDGKLLTYDTSGNVQYLPTISNVDDVFLQPSIFTISNVAPYDNEPADLLNSYSLNISSPTIPGLFGFSSDYVISNIAYATISTQNDATEVVYQSSTGEMIIAVTPNFCTVRPAGSGAVQLGVGTQTSYGVVKFYYPPTPPSNQPIPPSTPLSYYYFTSPIGFSTTLPTNQAIYMSVDGYPVVQGDLYANVADKNQQPSYLLMLGETQISTNPLAYSFKVSSNVTTNLLGCMFGTATTTTTISSSNNTVNFVHQPSTGYTQIFHDSSNYYVIQPTTTVNLPMNLTLGPVSTFGVVKFYYAYAS